MSLFNDFYLKELVNAKSEVLFNNNYYSNYRSSYYNNYGGNDIPNCVYSEIEKKYSIQNIIDEIKPLHTKLSVLQQDLQLLTDSSYLIKNQINNEKQNYGISLQEKIANESNTVYDKTQVKSNLTQSEQQYFELQNQITQKNSEIKEVNDSIYNIAVKNLTAITNIFDDYNSAIKLVEFERALLLFLLISPILFFTVKKYLKYKRENSQYTIIWAAVTTIFALLFAQVFFVFIYKILPIELIAKLLEFFAQFAFLVTIGQYLLLFITPVIFGGIVYWIQKKVYNKEAVMIRSLKNHKCPSCTMSLRETDRYCPVCHYQIKEKCPSCSGDRVVGLSFCPICGVKK